MKSFAITLTLCFFSFVTLAADSTVVKLMQKVITLNVEKYYPYFYMLNEGKNPVFDNNCISNIAYRFPTLAPSLPLNDFLKQINSDTSKIDWTIYNLPRAKCVDIKHLPMHSVSTIIIHYMPWNTKTSVIDSLKARDQVIVIVTPKSTKASSQKAEKKAVAAYRAKWPPEKRDHFIFSKPIFSNDGQYVLVSVDRGYEGGEYIFKNINGAWELVCAFNDWVT